MFRIFFQYVVGIMDVLCDSCKLHHVEYGNKLDLI